MHFLVNIISPFPTIDVHQLHIAKINRLMVESHHKTGIWIRGRNNRLRERAPDRMFQCKQQGRTLTPSIRGHNLEDSDSEESFLLHHLAKLILPIFHMNTNQVD